MRAPGYCWKQYSPAVTCCPPACCAQAIAAALDHTGPSPFGPNPVAVPKNPWPTPVQPPQFAGEPPLEAAVPSGDVPVHTDCSYPGRRIWPNASMTIGLSSLEFGQVVPVRGDLHAVREHVGLRRAREPRARAGRIVRQPRLVGPAQAGVVGRHLADPVGIGQPAEIAREQDGVEEHRARPAAAGGLRGEREAGGADGEEGP